MMQSQLGIRQNTTCFVKYRHLGVFPASELVIFLLQLLRIQPRFSRLLQLSKVIGHAAKLSPQEQCATAFGLVTLKPPFYKSSLKARPEPLTKSALFGSTTTRTFEVSTIMSRLAGPSTKSILYCRPEQPPPITATRSAPLGRPCFSSSDDNLRDAPSVTLIRRSLPIL